MEHEGACIAHFPVYDHLLHLQLFSREERDYASHSD